MILSTHGIVGSQIGQFTGLLDTYSGGAAAYSLRKLRAGYTGSAIRVRRASDNTEQNIGFVNNVLDTASLTSFCSGTDGFVTTWYDQSGNGRNATQTTAANQPQIVSGGSVILENAKPCVNFNGSKTLNTSLISSSTEATIISVSRHSPTIAYQTIVGIGIGNGYALTTSNLKYNLFYRNVADQTTIDNALSTQALIFAYTKTATNQQLFANNVSFQNITPSTMITPSTSSVIGAYDATTGLYTGTQQELIVYANIQLTNRSGIQNNINLYYGIY
jgi:hypothetical protein